MRCECGLSGFQDTENVSGIRTTRHCVAAIALEMPAGGRYGALTVARDVLSQPPGVRTRRRGTFPTGSRKRRCRLYV